MLHISKIQWRCALSGRVLVRRRSDGISECDHSVFGRISPDDRLVLPLVLASARAAGGRVRLLGDRSCIRSLPTTRPDARSSADVVWITETAASAGLVRGEVS